MDFAMDTSIAEEIYNVAVKRLGMIITPHHIDLTHAEVYREFVIMGKDVELLDKGDHFLARFKTESDLKATVEHMQANPSLYPFSVKKEVEDKKSTSIINDLVSVSEKFPDTAVSTFMAKYDTNYPTQPLLPPTEPLTMKKRRFRMNDSTLFKPLGAKKCTICFKLTTYQCSRTDKFTCSIECQEQRMKKASGVAEDQLQAGREVSGQRFVLVGYTSVETLVVRPLQDQERFLRLMNTVATLAKTSRNAMSLGDSTVLAFYRNLWYRGTVTAKIDKASVRVFLPDLLVEPVFLLKQLKLPTDNALLLEPSTAVECHLRGIIRSGMSYGAEQILEGLVEDQTPLVAHGESLNNVEFNVDHVGGPNLREMLNKTLTMEVSNEGPTYYLKDLPTSKVVPQENVPMLVTDLSDCALAVSLAHPEFFKRCYRYESHFQEFAEASAGYYTPCDKELCLVRMRSSDIERTRWLRAYGLLNQGDRFPRFELLDYGMAVKVSIADVRKIPKELLYPAATLAYSPAVTDPDLKSFVERGPYTMYPVVIAKIEPATAEKPTDRFHCPDLLVKLKAFTALGW